MFSFEAAPVFLAPPDQFSLPSYLVALVLGAYFFQYDIRPKAYRIASIAALFVVIRTGLKVPSDAIAIALMPALLVIRSNKIANLVLGCLGLAQMAIAPVHTALTVGSLWTTIFAAYWLATSGTWTIYAARALVIAARFFGPYGATSLVCGAILATSEVGDSEEALLILGAWVLAIFLGQWFPVALAAVAVVDVLMGIY